MNSAAHLPVLVILIPLLTAVIIPLVGRIHRELAWYAAAIGTFATFVYTLYLLSAVIAGGPISYWMGGWEPPWGIEYAVDHLNGFVLAIVSFIGFVVMIFAPKSVDREIGEDRSTLFYAVYMLFITGSMGVTITGDIFNLYVFIEITSLSVYTLIALGRSRQALVASFNYLILGTIAGTFILIGVGYLYIATGTLNMADLSQRLPALYTSNAVRTAFAFFTVGLALKIALFPLHIWLPKAYAQAPSVVSAVVAATATKVGVYVLLRIMFTVFTVDFDIRTIPMTKILLVLSCIGIVAGSVIAIAQTNIKRMLAYSSIGQIGYIALGAAIANEASMTGSIVHILNHALMKCSLFLVAGAVLYKVGVVHIDDFKGLGKRMPFTMAAFTLAALSMIGVPLTVGFVSKWYLAVGAIDAGMWYLIPVILASSLLTVVYFWRIVEYAYFHKAPPRQDGLTQSCDDAPFSMIAPIYLLTALTVIFGIWAYIPLNVAGAAARSLLGIN